MESDALIAINKRREIRELSDIARIYLAEKILGDLLSDGINFPLDVGVDDFVRNAKEQLTYALKSDEFKKATKRHSDWNSLMRYVS